ncbi:cytochrome c-type biogenesis protein [Frankineae bacterium MT45]|nr:cytochrome c-type biogenesis protein [Frankineae bacterium MT45]
MTILASGTFVDTINTGPLLVAAAVAALVGLVGFLSPCVLPLVPGYLAYVAGITGADEAHVRRRTILGTSLFIIGFSAVFVTSGLLFGTLGESIQEHKQTLERIFGSITIVLGIVFLGGIPFLQREVKIHARPRAGLIGAPLLGITFGLAWTPCLTPTLSAVTSMALSQASAARGAFLTAAYCLGLGIPFLLVAFGFGWATSALGFLRRHAGIVSRIGGIALILMGILLVTGLWDHWMSVLATYGNSGLGADL